MMMADNRWQNQYTQQKYSNSREERKTNLTKLGQIAIANPEPYYQQYSNVQYQPTVAEKDISNQLKLLKSKMNYKNNNEDIDQQTYSVNQQLNTLNDRLKGKGGSNTQQNYDPYLNQNPFGPARNYRTNPTYNQEPPQQKEGNNTYSSYSANNNNFVNNNLPRNRPYNPTNYQDNKQQDYIKPQPYSTQQNSYKPYEQSQPLNNRNNTQSNYNNNYIQYSQNQNQYQEPRKQQQNQYQNQQIQIQEDAYKPSMLTKNQPPRQNKPQQNQFSQPAQRNPLDDIPAVAKNNNANKFQIDEIANDDDLELIECPEGCGRQFNNQALDKHVKVCKKVFQSKRKEFNSKAHRIVSQEQTKLQKQGQVKDKVIQQKQKIQNNGDPKWKKQSEQFRNMIQSNRQGGNALNDVKYQNPYEDDYVECKGCGRKFNEKAAEKHIPNCMNKQKMQKYKGRR